MGSKGGSSAPEQRALTQQELDLLDSQRVNLDQATEVASKQYNLSNEDREYVAQVYRGDLDPSDPKVVAEVQKRMSNLKPPTREEWTKQRTTTSYGNGGDIYGSDSEDSRTITTTEDIFDEKGYEDAVKAFNDQKETLVRQVSGDLGGKGVDELLFEAVTSSKTEAAKLLGDWKNKAIELGDTYTSQLTGISDKFKNTLQTKSDAMGTADTDMYARTKGENLAGISQAYAEARRQAEGGLARRGLSGSGVAEQGISNLYGQEAQQKAQALGQSYNQAIALSDQRRTQQMGIAGQIAQSGTATAGSIYQTGLGTQTSILQNNLANQQQNIANLQLASGVSQGIFGQSANMLAGAGSTANQTASIAGTTASAYGQMDNQYQMNMQNNAANDSGGLMGAALSAGVGAMTGGIGTGLAGMAMSGSKAGTNALLAGGK